MKEESIKPSTQSRTTGTVKLTYYNCKAQNDKKRLKYGDLSMIEWRSDD